MSVTALVRDKTFVKKLRSIYPAYKLLPTGEVQVPRSHERSDHIGIAFDYLYRLVLARVAGMPYPHLYWEADRALAQISPHDDETSCSFECPITGKIHHTTEFVDGMGVKRHLWAVDALSTAKSLAAHYHVQGEMTDDLLWAFYELSYLEVVARGGPHKAVHIDIHKLSERDVAAISELRLLVETVDLDGLKITSNLLLSPTLPAAKLTSGGAPDLIVDGWICELKAVTYFGDASKWFDQLVLYAVLAAMGGFEIWGVDFWTSTGSKRTELLRPEVWIKGVAIYFARHAQWVRMSLDDIFTMEQIIEVGQLLCQDLKDEKFRTSLLDDLQAFICVRTRSAKCEMPLTVLQSAALTMLRRERGVIPAKLSTPQAHAMRALSKRGLARLAPVKESPYRPVWIPC